MSDERQTTNHERRAPPVIVAAAVVERDDAFLLTRRLEGTHLAGTWEFPGGKCDAGESPGDCLVRELREELATGSRVGERILVTRHTYPERSVELHFFHVELTDEPVPQLGQQMRWVPRGELKSLDLPPADADLIQLLIEWPN